MTDPDDAYLAREARAPRTSSRQLDSAGWIVESADQAKVTAGPGVAVREFILEKGHGRVDYLLFVDGEPAGVIEAKTEGTTLVEVEHESGKYVDGLPDWIKPPVHPLPFIYESTGAETRFTSGYDPDARSRGCLRSIGLRRSRSGRDRSSRHPMPRPFERASRRCRPLIPPRRWGVQATAIANLEESLRLDRPRALIQMATGSGKTFTAANVAFRLIRHADAKRILFLVDRSTLGKQTKLEFEKFVIPDTAAQLSFRIQHPTPPPRTP